MRLELNKHVSKRIPVTSLCVLRSGNVERVWFVSETNASATGELCYHAVMCSIGVSLPRCREQGRGQFRCITVHAVSYTLHVRNGDTKLQSECSQGRGQCTSATGPAHDKQCICIVERMDR